MFPSCALIMIIIKQMVWELTVIWHPKNNANNHRTCEVQHRNKEGVHSRIVYSTHSEYVSCFPLFIICFGTNIIIDIMKRMAYFSQNNNQVWEGSVEHSVH